MEACGLSNFYCSLDLSGANVVMVDGQSHPPRGIFYGEPLKWSNWRAVGPAGSHVDVLAPSPSLDGLLWPGQWLIYPPGLS